MTIKLVKAVRVRALPGHRLDIAFSDGSSGIIDLTVITQSQGEMARPLADEAFFSQVFLEMGTPTWPNGYNVDPINVWMKLKAAGELRTDGVTV